ncbi:ribonuclease P protein subunit Rpp25 isoform X2 [Rhynchophorus ferrugineus]|uniref:ribonuclease P protein subunit Rpp25 isoform X2 n=1 Tax=Rhynchophorus ferrugineus TaxID=354439 RepID=UPI003FCC5E2E
MENYRKGRNDEELLDRIKIPISDLPEQFLWMQVRGGSKIRNLLDHALNNFPDSKVVVWTGCGASVGKTVTCAEIMKREYNNTLHQITKLCYRSVDEYWDPLLSDMDQLVVKRKLPTIHICLSLNPLNTEDLGTYLGIKLQE